MSENDPDGDIPDIPMAEILRTRESCGGTGGDGHQGKQATPRSVPVSQDDSPRREFFSIALGTAIVAVPAAVGLRVVASPLFTGKTGGVLARLTTLDSLEVGGAPQAFKVIADKVDAWTTYKDLPLGLVYLQRVGDKDVVAFSASCPHAGCAVEYRREGEIKGVRFEEHYYCPCHESAFALGGEIASAGSPAKRGLDTLEVDKEKMAGGEVWVRFRKFKAGIREKKPLS